MSENSSDSESSCGWTILNHEGSDIETLNSENGETGSDFPLEQSEALEEELRPDTLPLGLPDLCGNENTASAIELSFPSVEEAQAAPEDLTHYGLPQKMERSLPDTFCYQEEEKFAEDVVCEAGSDDSDIVTLEPPRADEIGPLDEDVAALEEEVAITEDVNLSSSFSSQYTFSQPETVFPSHHSADDSSNDEASDVSGPALRRRRAKKDSEHKAPADPPAPVEPRTFGFLGRSLNKCIILALIIAMSMGFGHFYGSVQILERQKHVEKIYEHELNDVKDDLHQCQKEQKAAVEQQGLYEHFTEDPEETQDMVSSLKGLMVKMTTENQLLRQKHTQLQTETDDLANALKTTEGENQKLAQENQYLRISLKKGEEAFSLLQEELRKLREQIRSLEEKGSGDLILSENRKLRTHLKEERQKIRSFLTQKEILLAEAQALRKELDSEHQITESLKAKLEEISNRQSPDMKHGMADDEETEQLRERLTDLEKKVVFEQQRSDLWERLYVDAKEQNEQQTEALRDSQKGQKKESRGKKKAKDTFFNSVKDTFDAMKNSTKEFVRHHKEKIKQAKEAVKENLRKFSDSVKSTFRQFKDSTNNMFDRNRYRKYTERRREETKEARTVRREYKSDSEEEYPKMATAGQNEYNSLHNDGLFKDEPPWKSTHAKKTSSEQCTNKKGCSGVFECAHQESFSLFNKVLDPVKVEDFNQLIQTYVQEQVDHFRHWKELEQFINKFFENGVFIHDQMLFTDFVNDVEDYLEDMKEYQLNNAGIFEDLDEYVYRHFFGSDYNTPHGPRKPDKNPPYKDAEGYRYRKQEQKHHQNRYRKEGKWNKHGRADGRHMANVEIDLGQLPFDPKY
ncbi:cell cycle progression protein 1 [Spea bombifrons]|uniref:cell cycle progression protein 1 n=1 Tax=Spea bombifrons TaxID=233779 RepID=UPI00234B1FB2|nr:cell cycle progression protein 1 [Spea bombifrons]